ncbi:MAG TPA: PAS domain S-box protein [Aggregatilinea sp.]|uniref:PAS domain S-box protein n=1 Tax=Aggregatilinea sp. TaxID=2806333 RepID=UPI002B8D1582|nr:PAS domain S-box protein [Aggregatilinea sp.]HML23956.1 PAS domain S-box protein [Aggregatilinea sp.]
MSNPAQITVFVVQPVPEDLQNILYAAEQSGAISLRALRHDHLADELTAATLGGDEAIFLYAPGMEWADLTALAEIRVHALRSAILVVTDTHDPVARQQALDAGAQICLPRIWLTPDLLVSAAQQAIDQVACQDALSKQRHELQISTINLRNIIDNSIDGIVVVDTRGKVRFVNPAAEMLFGCENEEMRGTPFEYPLNIGETSELNLTKLGGTPLIIEMRVGTVVWEGEIAFLASLRDVTANKQAGEILREERDFSSAVLDTVAALVVVMDPQGRIVRCNRAWETLTGYRGNEVSGHYFWDMFIIPDETPDIRARFSELAAGQFPNTHQSYVICKSGERRLIAWSNTALLGPDGTVNYLMGTGIDITERTEVEMTLQRSEARFRAVFAQAPVGMMLTDLGGRLVASNAALQRMLGYSAEELSTLTFDAITHDADLPLNERYFRELVLGHRDQYQIEKRYLHKNGNPVWVRVTAYPVKSPGIDRQMILAMAEDITERKQAEQAEHEQRALTDALRDAAEALTMTLEVDEVLDRLLTSVARVVPSDSTNIMLMEGDRARVARWQGHYDEANLGDWLSNDVLRLDQSPSLKQVLESGEPFIIDDAPTSDSWIPRPQTRWIQSHIKVPIRRHGRVFGFLNLDSARPAAFTHEHARLLQTFADQAAVAIWNAQLYDDVRRHAAELEERVAQRTLELARERAQLETILDAMGEGVIYLDNDRRVLYINRAFVALLGYDSQKEDTRAASIGAYERALASINEPNAWRAEVADALRQDLTWCEELTLQRADGSTFDAALTINAVIGPDGQQIGQVELIRDVSQEKALREQKDRFIANASHELRTPITNIKMRLYLLGKDPSRLAEHLSILDYVTRRMESLVDDLLDMSRFERGTIMLKRENVELQPLLERIITVQEPHADAKHIDMVVQLPHTPLCVYADANRIAQVLTNLITNSINYTPESGHIEVSLDREISENGPQAVICVRDTGIGIPSDQLSQVFEPFFRGMHGASKGTGLGLTISKEIIELHGGTISVDSRFGQGSVFTVRLGLSETSAQQHVGSGA